MSVKLPGLLRVPPRLLPPTPCFAPDTLSLSGRRMLRGAGAPEGIPIAAPRPNLLHVVLPFSLPVTRLAVPSRRSFWCFFFSLVPFPLSALLAPIDCGLFTERATYSFPSRSLFSPASLSAGCSALFARACFEPVLLTPRDPRSIFSDELARQDRS